MKALIQHGYGVLRTVLRDEERPVPQPAPKEALVRARAAGVNPLDHKLAEGEFKLFVKVKPPCGVGFDVCGTVEAHGAGVTAPPLGARVVGLIPAFTRAQPGAIAQFARVPAAQLVELPDAVSDTVAAALPVAGMTALQACRVAELGPGRRVLVTGAAGGVGHLAVQIAARLGAEVTAAARAAQLAFLRTLGAAHVVDSAAPERWGGPFDAVLDFAALLSPPTFGGQFGRDGGHYVITLPRFPDLFFEPLANRVSRVKRHTIKLEPLHEDLVALVREVAEGRLHVHVARVFSYAQAVEALETQRRGGVEGKLVVQMA